MKAMVITAFGGPEVFEQHDIPRPEPGIGELLVRVRATSVNPVDCKIRQDGGWAGVSPRAVIGYDAAGVVEEIGPGVKAFKPRDEVFYTPLIFGGQGTYAEYNVVSESIVAAKPRSLSFIEAASLPLAGCTAWDGIIGFGQVQLGETVLQHAGAGGVGSLAVQMAKAAGARVLSTCRGSNADLVKSLGADVTIDYRAERFEDAVLRATSDRGADLVYDAVGGDTLSRSVQVTRPRGRLISIVDTSGDLNTAFLRNLTVSFLFMERAGYKMEALKTLVERGQLKPVIDSVMPLERVAEAHRRLEAGGVRGKIVLEVSPGQ